MKLNFSNNRKSLGSDGVPLRTNRGALGRRRRHGARTNFHRARYASPLRARSDLPPLVYDGERSDVGAGADRPKLTLGTARSDPSSLSRLSAPANRLFFKNFSSKSQRLASPTRWRKVAKLRTDERPAKRIAVSRHRRDSRVGSEPSSAPRRATENLPQSPATRIAGKKKYISPKFQLSATRDPSDSYFASRIT